ncbi:hypothetical protein C0993_003383, partial [Termitomyces sp. T159_Od127]
KQKTKESPVAVLNTATFQAVTEAILLQDFIQILISSMHSKRSSEYPDDGLSSSFRKTKTKQKTLNIPADTPAETLLQKDDLKQGLSGTPHEKMATDPGPSESAVDRVPPPVKQNQICKAVKDIGIKILFTC